MAEVGDRVRQAAETIYQALVEAELTAVIGAGPHERTKARFAQRNGHRPWALSTPAGIWSCGPSCAPARSSPACLSGVAGWIRRVRGGDGGLSCTESRPARSTIWPRPPAPTRGSPSPRCRDLRRPRRGGSRRSGTAPWPARPTPYVFLDATYCQARVNRRVVSQAIVVATGVGADGWREVLGFAVGDSEDGAFGPRSCARSRLVASPECRAGHLRRPRAPITPRGGMRPYRHPSGVVVARGEQQQGSWSPLRARRGDRRDRAATPARTSVRCSETAEARAGQRHSKQPETQGP